MWCQECVRVIGKSNLFVNCYNWQVQLQSAKNDKQEKHLKPGSLIYYLSSLFNNFTHVLHFLQRDNPQIGVVDHVWSILISASLKHLLLSLSRFHVCHGFFKKGKNSWRGIVKRRNKTCWNEGVSVSNTHPPLITLTEIVSCRFHGVASMISLRTSILWPHIPGWSKMYI